MSLQSYLLHKFSMWSPPPPTVEGRTKCDVTLRWSIEPFGFLDGELLFWVEKKQKMPCWVRVYSGGKTMKVIDNLAPRHPHTFRVKVILQATAVSTFAERALKHFGDENAVYKALEDRGDSNEDSKENGADYNNSNGEENQADNSVKSEKSGGDETIPRNILGSDLAELELSVNVVDSEEARHLIEESNLYVQTVDAAGNGGDGDNSQSIPKNVTSVKKWLESQWSEETSTSTDTDGTSAVCFCMAVRCGYLKQLQVMLEERPALLEIINSNNGFTPLATAIRKGDLNTVKFLIAAGADVNQPSSTGQMPLHLAVLGGRTQLVDLLLDNGADFQARDINGLRIEHYAVDAGRPEMLSHILERGGDLNVKDSNGWTPLFRAVTQGASTELIELLVLSGSDVEVADYAGLSLPSAARLLRNRQGRVRDSILRLVDSQYPREQAVANFTRLTKKISSIHTILK